MEAPYQTRSLLVSSSPGLDKHSWVCSLVCTVSIRLTQTSRDTHSMCTLCLEKGLELLGVPLSWAPQAPRADTSNPFKPYWDIRYFINYTISPTHRYKPVTPYQIWLNPGDKGERSNIWFGVCGKSYTICSIHFMRGKKASDSGQLMTKSYLLMNSFCQAMKDPNTNIYHLLCRFVQHFWYFLW